MCASVRARNWSGCSLPVSSEATRRSLRGVFFEHGMVRRWGPKCFPNQWFLVVGEVGHGVRSPRWNMRRAQGPGPGGTAAPPVRTRRPSSFPGGGTRHGPFHRGGTERRFRRYLPEVPAAAKDGPTHRVNEKPPVTPATTGRVAKATRFSPPPRPHTHQHPPHPHTTIHISFLSTDKAQRIMQ